MKMLTDTAKELAWMQPGDAAYEGWEVVVNEQFAQDRWSGHYTLIIKCAAAEEYWETTYSKGLTEYQSESPFEDEGDEVEFTRVHPVQVTTITYAKDAPGEPGRTDQS